VQARELLLDGAEASLVKRGYRGSTMAAIAKEAGYTRAVIYRHFDSRDDLLEALVLRVATRHINVVVARSAGISDAGDLVVESLVIIATEIARDPLLAVISERSDHMSVAEVIVSSPRLTNMLTTMYDEALKEGQLRDGLRPGDAARFVLAIAIGLLRRTFPDTADPDQVRRFTRVFVLPALLADPPPATPVFKPL
jgi:AcrR family transcriptional regulator